MAGHVTILRAAGRVVFSQRVASDVTHTFIYIWKIYFMMFESHTHVLDKQINKYTSIHHLP